MSDTVEREERWRGGVGKKQQVGGWMGGREEGQPRKYFMRQGKENKETLKETQVVERGVEAKARRGGSGDSVRGGNSLKIEEI